MMANSVTSFTVSSYNCRGFNSIKSRYIASLFARCNVLFLQEHWLADGQLSMLADISENISYTAVSGFDSDDVLVGRPFGGCAILWQANLLASVCPIKVDSRRVCAVRVCFDAWNLLLISVYMPYEDGSENLDEFVNTLSLIEGIVDNNRDCHVILGGILMLISVGTGHILLYSVVFVMT
jgi:hypothetical protein